MHIWYIHDIDRPDIWCTGLSNMSFFGEKETHLGFIIYIWKHQENMPVIFPLTGIIILLLSFHISWNINDVGRGYEGYLICTRIMNYRKWNEKPWLFPFCLDDQSGQISSIPYILISVFALWWNSQYNYKPWLMWPPSRSVKAT